MRKYITMFLWLCAITPMSSFANSARINQLVAEKQAKIEQLQKCRGTTKNLKIAGLSTLGITAAGVVANVAEAVILKDKKAELDFANTQLQNAKDKNYKSECEIKYKGVYQDKVCTIKRKINGLNKDNAVAEFNKIVNINTNCDKATTQDEITWTMVCKQDEYKLSVILIATQTTKTETIVEKNTAKQEKDISNTVEKDAASVSETKQTSEDETQIIETPEPTFLAHALDGSCRIPDEKKKSYGTQTSKELCASLAIGEWLAKAEGNEYRGFAKCSATETEKILNSKSEIDDKLGKQCWCKVSDNWVFWETIASPNACKVICADRCAFITYGMQGEFAEKIKKALGIE